MTKLEILAFILYIPICLQFSSSFVPDKAVNVKLDVIGCKRTSSTSSYLSVDESLILFMGLSFLGQNTIVHLLHFKVVDIIGPVPFLWHN